MGIPGLPKLVPKKCIKPTKIESYANKTIPFDTFGCLYKCVIAIRNRNEGKDIMINETINISHAYAIIYKTLSILRHSIVPFWYIDGKPHKWKKILC